MFYRTKNRAGFTMVEVVFAIVVLGILSSIVITSFSATRTDANVSSAVADFQSIVRDITAYYIATGRFDLCDTANCQLPMTDVAVTKHATGNDFYYRTKLNDEICVLFRTFDSTAGTFQFNVQNAHQKAKSQCNELFET